MKEAITIVVTFLLAVSATARTITVDDDGPADFNNIQAAIDDSNDGDTVLVADGIYTRNGNRDIDFHGKAITVKSENGPETCIIDCNGTATYPHGGFGFRSGEDANSVLEGVTVSNAIAWDAGGAIVCGGSSPTIRNCIIKDNRVLWMFQDAIGGGIYCYSNSSPTIVDCIITGNRTGDAAGIYCRNSSPVIRNCTISNNSAGNNGGGIYSDNGNLTISHCRISGNRALRGSGIYCTDSSISVRNCQITANKGADDGGGIYSDNSSVSLLNCVFSGNDTDEDGAVISSYYSSISIINCTIDGYGAVDYLDDDADSVYGKYSDVEITNSIVMRLIDAEQSKIVVTFSNVPSPWPGEGNIHADPCFVSPGLRSGYDWVEGDYHLKSQAGRYDPNTDSWVMDDVTSPCIDAGDYRSPLGLEPFPNGGIVNMGAYGGTLEASKPYFGGPPCETIVAGDINGDCEVDFEDFRLMALHWLGNTRPNSVVTERYLFLPDPNGLVTSGGFNGHGQGSRFIQGWFGLTIDTAAGSAEFTWVGATLYGGVWFLDDGLETFVYSDDLDRLFRMTELASTDVNDTAIDFVLERGDCPGCFPPLTDIRLRATFEGNSVHLVGNFCDPCCDLYCYHLDAMAVRQ